MCAAVSALSAGTCHPSSAQSRNTRLRAHSSNAKTGRAAKRVGAMTRAIAIVPPDQ